MVLIIVHKNLALFYPCGFYCGPMLMDPHNINNPQMVFSKMGHPRPLFQSFSNKHQYNLTTN